MSEYSAIERAADNVGVRSKTFVSKYCDVEPKSSVCIRFAMLAPWKFRSLRQQHHPLTVSSVMTKMPSSPPQQTLFFFIPKLHSTQLKKHFYNTGMNVTSGLLSQVCRKNRVNVHRLLLHCTGTWLKLQNHIADLTKFLNQDIDRRCIDSLIRISFRDSFARGETKQRSLKWFLVNLNCNCYPAFFFKMPLKLDSKRGRNLIKGVGSFVMNLWTALIVFLSSDKNWRTARLYRWITHPTKARSRYRAVNRLNVIFKVLRG